MRIVRGGRLLLMAAVVMVCVAMIAASARAECLVREDTGHFAIDSQGGLVESESGGSGFFDGTYLPYDHGDVRFIQWFYDHPFSYDRWKEVFVAYVIADRLPDEHAWGRMYLVWTTPFWDMQTPDPMTPPGPAEQFLNGLPTYAFELAADYDKILHGQAHGHCWEWTIPEFNPVWVGIMLVGENINGGFDITHACCGEVPEPGTTALLGLAAGIAGLGALRRRRQSTSARHGG